VPAPLCSTHLPTRRGRAGARPLPRLGLGEPPEWVSVLLQPQKCPHVAVGSCVLSGALGGDVFGSCASGSGLAQEAAPALGKPAFVFRAGKSGAKQMSVSGLIRVSGGEHGLTVCAAPTGPGLTPVKLIH